MKIAIVTGGSRGLGKAMAISLANKGRDLIVTYNNRKSDADDVVSAIEAAGQKAVALRLDVADSSSFPAFAANVRKVLEEKWDRVSFDFLVNNAGIGIHAPIL